MANPEVDIHNYKGRFDRTVQKIKESHDISEQDKIIINQFKDYCICQGISYGKIDAYLFYTTKLVKMLQIPIEQATKQDLMKLVAELNQSKYSEETKVCFKIMIRKKLIPKYRKMGLSPKDIKEVLDEGIKLK